MIDHYLNKHTQLDSSKNSWERSWHKQAFGAANIIDIGRRVYNCFLLRFLKKYINHQTNFLEFGCGTASLGVLIANDVNNYTGFDIAENALNEAHINFEKKGIKNYSLAIKDIIKIEEGEKFDLVWSQGLIEHFYNTRLLVAAHLAACQKGGRVIISVPAKYSYHYLWYLLTRPKYLRLFWPWPDEIFISKKIFHQCLQSLKGQYLKYKIIDLKPRILGLLILVIEK